MKKLLFIMFMSMIHIHLYAAATSSGNPMLDTHRQNFIDVLNTKRTELAQLEEKLNDVETNIERSKRAADTAGKVALDTTFNQRIEVIKNKIQEERATIANIDKPAVLNEYSAYQFRTELLPKYTSINYDNIEQDIAQLQQTYDQYIELSSVTKATVEPNPILNQNIPKPEPSSAGQHNPQPEKTASSIRRTQQINKFEQEYQDIKKVYDDLSDGEKEAFADQNKDTRIAVQLLNTTIPARIDAWKTKFNQSEFQTSQASLQKITQLLNDFKRHGASPKTSTPSGSSSGTKTTTPVAQKPTIEEQLAQHAGEKITDQNIRTIWQEISGSNPNKTLTVTQVQALIKFANDPEGPTHRGKNHLWRVATQLIMSNPDAANAVSGITPELIQQWQAIATRHLKRR